MAVCDIYSIRDFFPALYRQLLEESLYVDNNDNDSEFTERFQSLKALYNLKKNTQHANTHSQINDI